MLSRTATADQIISLAKTDDGDAARLCRIVRRMSGAAGFQRIEFAADRSTLRFYGLLTVDGELTPTGVTLWNRLRS